MTHGEDCLYLNVYTPIRNLSLPALPVMVWVHGGGFTLGSGSEYDATSLATKDIVLVTINYRLGVFGFLSTETKTLPGNYGMLDQVAALKWVKQNIASFGGDPNLVTVFGESAGSVSVSHLVISPLTNGLFQRAILQSGSSLAYWAVQSYPANRVSHKMAARLISVAVNCFDLENSTNNLACLQSVDGSMLLSVSMAVTNALGTGNVMNPRIDGKGGFLPESPIDVILSGQAKHVDIMAGFNADESGLFFPLLTKDNPHPNIFVENTIRMALGQFSEARQYTILNQIKSGYITENATHEVMRQQLLDAMDDFMFVGDTMKQLVAMSARAPERKHFLYEFHHRPSRSPFPDWVSAVHGDEIEYVFNVSRKPFVDRRGGPPSPTDVQVSRQMMEMWSNFAKTGDPSATVAAGGASWKPFSVSQPHYLRISDVSEAKLWTDRKVTDVFDTLMKSFAGDTSNTENVVG